MRRFNLVGWFMAIAVATIATVSLVSASLLSSFIEQRMLALDARMTTEFVNHILNVEQTQSDHLGITTQLHANEEGFFRHLGAMPDVVRANVFAPDGLVLWSTDEALIGKRFKDNSELAVSLRGEPEYALGDVAELTKEEHARLRVPGGVFVENYLPVFDHGQPGRAVVAVVEVYRLPAAVFETIAAGEERIYVSAVLGGLFIMATLFWVVRRADRVMRRQEAVIAQGERLSTAGEMASAVAHGLRNPLASIRSAAELAVRLKDRPRVNELLEDIVTQSDRLENWVRQYLSTTHVETTEEGTTDLRSVVGRVLETYSADMSRQSITARNQLPPSLPPVRIGQVVLEQVANGLVANAMEAMEGGGQITISASHVGSMIELEVQDTGCGMDDAGMADAFAPFRTSKRNGLGLGLALSRRILSRHGATIALRSAPGKGTTAVVRVPVAA